MINTELLPTFATGLKRPLMFNEMLK